MVTFGTGITQRDWVALDSFNCLCNGRPTDTELNRSEEHTSELQSRPHLVCRLLLEKKNLEESRAVQPAPGGKLRADESRRTDCVFAHRGSVFGCNGAKRSLETRPGILWYEVRVSDGALRQEGLVDDPTWDYLNPSFFF